MTTAALIAYTLLLLGTSLIPMDQEIEGLGFIIAVKPSTQNLLHIPAYTLFSILALLAFGKRPVWVVSGIIAFGVFNELVQLPVPGRYASVMDMGLNTIGTIIGVILYYTLLQNRLSLRSSRSSR